jgi:hypothetical protein
MPGFSLLTVTVPFHDGGLMLATDFECIGVEKRLFPESFVGPDRMFLDENLEELLLGLLGLVFD